MLADVELNHKTFNKMLLMAPYLSITENHVRATVTRVFCLLFNFDPLKLYLLRKQFSIFSHNSPSFSRVKVPDSYQFKSQ